MKGSTKSGKWMSPWRYKKATEIMSVVCSLKLKQCWAHFVWPFSPVPWSKGRGLRRGVGAPQLSVAPSKPSPPRKGEATRCTYRIPSTLTIQLTIDQHYRKARWIDNFLYKAAVASAASACGKTPGDVFAPGCFLLRPRARPGTQPGRSAPQAGHEFAEHSAKQKVHRRERRID